MIKHIVFAALFLYTLAGCLDNRTPMGDGGVDSGCITRCAGGGTEPPCMTVCSGWEDAGREIVRDAEPLDAGLTGIDAGPSAYCVGDVPTCTDPTLSAMCTDDVTWLSPAKCSFAGDAFCPCPLHHDCPHLVCIIQP